MEIGERGAAGKVGVNDEAFELVTEGRRDLGPARAVACDNPIRLHASLGPGFLDGTAIEDHVRGLLADDQGERR